MNTKFKKALSIIIIMIMIFHGSMSAQLINGKLQSSTINPPSNYNFKLQSIDEFNITEMTAGGQSDILLIQDNLPWNSSANDIVLKDIGVSYDKVKTSQLSSIDLGSYKVVIIANDQSVSSYANYKSIREQLDYFVNIGGVLIFGAADNGWASGSFDWELPGGVRKETLYSDYNYIDDYDSPIVTGLLSDGVVLSDSDLYSNHCSHTVFDEASLPSGSNVILRSTDNNLPTLVEYPVGNGYIIASGLTWEHGYAYYNESNIGDFSRIAMDDLFLYAIQKSDSDRTIEKMQIFEDNNSFEHAPANFFSDSESQEYLISDEYFNKLASFYENTWFENIIGTVGIKNQLQKARVSKWGGSCHGISVSMALSHIGEIDINNFDNSVEHYYDFPKPKDNLLLRDLLNYYQLSQYLQIIDDNSISVPVSDKKSLKKELETIVGLAKESEESGYPFLFSFSWTYIKYLTRTSAGHTIVCVGVKETDDYYRLQFVDPNSVNSYIYARVSKEYDSIAFEDKYNEKEKYSFKLTWVGHEFLSNYSKIDIDGADNSLVLNSPITLNGFIDDTYNVDIIVFNSDSSFEIVARDGKYLRFEDAEITGTMEMMDINFCEKGDSVDYQIMVSDNSQYKITPLSEHVDVCVYDTQGSYTAFVGSNADEIIVDLGTGIEVVGNDMNYDVFYGAQGDNTQMLSLSALNSDHIQMIEKQDNIQVKGEGLTDCKVKGYYESIVYSIEVDDSDSFSIKKDNEIKYEINFVRPSINSLNYGDILVLGLDNVVLPLNSKFIYYSEDEAVSIQESDNGKIYVTSQKSGLITIIVKAVDENGNSIYDADGNEIYDEITLKSNVNFWTRLISFFKNLFGMDRYVY